MGHKRNHKVGNVLHWNAIGFGIFLGFVFEPFPDNG